MRAFEDINPIAITIYYLMVIGIVMFFANPIIFLISLFGALCFYLTRNGTKNGSTHFYSWITFLILILINPLVSHNGVTVLFVMNNNPVTFEAIVYGVCAAIMIVAVLYWCYSFSQIMTSDKLLYIFGALSPKLALMISMALRYVPLFNSQSKKVNQAQKALGLYKEDNIVDNFKGGLRVFSIMTTWALENGIITADSMAYRGYGRGRRTHFSEYRFKIGDVVFLIVSVLLCVIAVCGIVNVEFVCYPAIMIPKISLENMIGYISYGLLIFLPTIIQVKEALKWKYLKSKI